MAEMMLFLRHCYSVMGASLTRPLINGLSACVKVNVCCKQLALQHLMYSVNVGFNCAMLCKMSVRLSVCLSVCHMPVFYRNG